LNCTMAASFFQSRKIMAGSFCGTLVTREFTRMRKW
jgi:hypothetical protein